MVIFTNISFDEKAVYVHGEDMDRNTSADVVVSLVSDDLKINNASSDRILGIMKAAWKLRRRLEKNHKLKEEEAVVWG